MTNALKRRAAKLEGAAGSALTEELLTLSPSDQLLYHMRRDNLLSLLKDLWPREAHLRKYAKDGGEAGGAK